MTGLLFKNVRGGVISDLLVILLIYLFLGSCNPCPETVDVKCNCGKTVIKVPCGRERTIKPPKCKQLCRSV